MKALKRLGLSACWIVLLATLVTTAGAQGEAQDEKDTAPRWLRLFAVGDSPPFRQEVVDGVRIELPPPPGSIPPRRVRVGALDSDSSPVRLRLREVSERILVRGQSAPVVAMPANGSPRSWLQLDLPEEATSVLGILFRRSSKETWDQPAQLLLRDDLVSFPNGYARVINASPYQARIVVGEEKLEVQRGKSRILPIRSTDRVENLTLKVQVGSAEAGWIRVYDSAMMQNADERTNIVIYRADGLKKRRPAKVVVLRDRASIPVLPAESGGNGS